MSDSEIANDEATEYTVLAQCSVLAIADLIHFLVMCLLPDASRFLLWTN